MPIFPEPTGPQVDPRHVSELDDAFFSSDPYAYFCARIQALTAEVPAVAYDTAIGAALVRLLQLPGDCPPPDARSVELQRAVDAVGLRQHVAETLVRMWLTALQTRTAGRSRSVWATLTDQPTQIQQVLDLINTHPDNSDPQVYLDLLYPPSIQIGLVPGSELARAANLLVDWLAYSERLLTRADLHLAAAHNKVKHGLAVRPRDDLRLDFFLNDPANGASEVPVSALQDPIPVIDKPSVLYLARPPRSPGGGKEGLELTCLRVDTPVVLAETFMLATVHAAVFHTAALRYLSDSEDVIGIPPFPTLPLGPTPEQLVGQAVTGLRAPVTYRPDGRPSDRQAGIAFNNFEFLPLQVTGSGRTVRVVEG